MSKSSIVKNTAFMTMASVGQKIISFTYFTLVARMVGSEGTGKYFLALSFTTVFVVFVDLGFTNVLVREGAKARDKMQNYLSTVLAGKVVFGIMSYVALIAVVNLMVYSAELKGLVYLSGITMLFDSLHLTVYGVFRAMGDLKWEAISITGSQLLTLIMGTTFLYLKLPLIFLILAFTISSFLNLCFAIFILHKKYHYNLQPVYDPDTFIKMGKIALPFALAAIFARVYSYIDSIIMSKVVGEQAVGWYSIPHKITYAFNFLPLALVAAVYPRFSEHFQNDRKKLQYIYQMSVKYLLIIVMPISVGIFVLADDIILKLYTVEYVNSILPLKILILSLIFTYISFPIGSLLNACNRQATQTWIVGITLVFDIILNLILIPRYGAVGAAIVVVLGNFMLVTLGYIVTTKIVKINHAFFINTFARLLLSAGVMAIVVDFVNVRVGMIPAILVGMVVYPVMAFVTKVVTTGQVVEAWHLLRQ